MYQATNTTHSQPVRTHAAKQARPIPHHLAPTAYQVGRVRTWLSSNAGLVCLAIGWVFAFVGIAIPSDIEISQGYQAEVAMEMVAMYLFGLGVGLIVREEGSRK